MRKVNRKSIYCLSAAAVALLVGGSVTAATAYKTVTVDVDGQAKEVSGFLFGTVEELLAREGVQVESEDLVQPAVSTELMEGTAITVTHAKSVAVIDGTGEPKQVKTQAQTVGDLLQQLGLGLGEMDIVDRPLTAAVEHNKTITITRRTQDVQTAEEAIPFQTERQPDANLDKGTEQVLTPGVNGKATIKTTIVFENGKEIDRKVDRLVVAEPSNQVIGVGTKERPVAPERPLLVASRGGSNLTATKTFTAMASGYSMPGGRTASGQVTGPGIVAVDPSVIPLGTKLYIEGYGYAVAADTGGAIKGNKVDLHFDTHAQAMAWGRRSVTVQILN